MSLPDASVDAVLCHLALMLFEPVGPVLAEIGRILRPGGMLAAVVPGGGGGSPEFAALRRELAAALAAEVAPERLIALGNREFSDLAAIDQAPLAKSGLEPEIEVAPFDVIFRELPERLAERLTPFFYYSHLLSEEAKLNLQQLWAGILRRTVPAGGAEAVFHLPLAIVKLRKK
jgi:SAM-dependent methyltransferase